MIGGTRMKKHYAFVPLKENDLSLFRRALISSLWFRPVFGVFILLLLGWLGFSYTSVLKASPVCLIFYVLAALFALYETLGEFHRLYFIARLKKSSLLPLIHSVKADASFYNEEIPNGFIIQTEPIRFPDITWCRTELSLILEQFTESLALHDYLMDCLGSDDASLINKAVIYTEIIKDQLARGNRAILATYDRLINYVNFSEKAS